MRVAFFEVGQIGVRQLPVVALHVAARELDEEAPDRVTDAARPAVQHHPDVIGLVHADLDEVVPGPEGAQMYAVIAPAQLGVLALDAFETRPELAPGLVDR